MADTLVELHDRPVCPGLSRVAASIVAASGLCCRGRTNAHSDPGPVPYPGPPHERDAPWQPNPAARPPPIFPRYLHTAEVADILHVSPKTVSRWAKEGKLPFLKTLGGHRRYPAAEIRQLADELQVRPTA